MGAWWSKLCNFQYWPPTWARVRPSTCVWLIADHKFTTPVFHLAKGRRQRFLDADSSFTSPFSSKINKSASERLWRFWTKFVTNNAELNYVCCIICLTIFIFTLGSNFVNTYRNFVQNFVFLYYLSYLHNCV